MFVCEGRERNIRKKYGKRTEYSHGLSSVVLSSFRPFCLFLSPHWVNGIEREREREAHECMNKNGKKEQETNIKRITNANGQNGLNKTRSVYVSYTRNKFICCFVPYYFCCCIIFLYAGWNKM